MLKFSFRLFHATNRNSFSKLLSGKKVQYLSQKTSSARINDSIQQLNKPILQPVKNLGILLAVFIIFFSSCETTKKVTYFQNIPKDTTLHNLVSKNWEATIQKADLLSITVASLSPENTAIFNAPQNAMGALAGYLVDEGGNIDFVKLGKLHVEGISRKELKAKLEKELSPYLKEAVVSVGFLNRHVTLMGAVAPQVLPMAVDNMTLLDALAAGGDIGTKGRPDNILVIREKDNGREFKRLNLTDESIFYSPYFYLQPNDIVYVEPVKEKRQNTTRIVSYVTAGISFAIFVIDRIIK